MTNPTPRPALRKAEDADVHPAAPKPARSPRPPRQAAPRTTAPAAPEPAPAPAPAPAPTATAAAPAETKPRKKRRYETPPAVPVAVKKRARKDFAGTTSDHLRPADAPTAAHDELHDRAGKKQKKAADLMGGGTGKLTVVVPKRLRKAAEKEAARRGLDVDAVVADLLHAWLTGRR